MALCRRARQRARARFGRATASRLTIRPPSRCTITRLNHSPHSAPALCSTQCAGARQRRSVRHSRVRERLAERHGLRPLKKLAWIEMTPVWEWISLPAQTHSPSVSSPFLTVKFFPDSTTQLHVRSEWCWGSASNCKGNWAYPLQENPEHILL